MKEVAYSRFPQFQIEDQDGAAVAVADILVGKGNWLHLAIATVPKMLIVVLDSATQRFVYTILSVPNMVRRATGLSLERYSYKICFREDYLKISARADELLRAHPSGDFIKGVLVTFAPKDPKLQGFVNAQGMPVDYVTRYFAPWHGVAEDPATGMPHFSRFLSAKLRFLGSAQCALAPFWSKALNKAGTMKGNMENFTGRASGLAFQCFPGRGAEFEVTPKPGGRLEIVGHSVTVIEGHIRL